MEIGLRLVGVLCGVMLVFGAVRFLGRLERFGWFELFGLLWFGFVVSGVICLGLFGTIVGLFFVSFLPYLIHF